MTQDEFQALTGEKQCFDNEAWLQILDIAELRLASFLCLEKFPELTDENKDLALLLAEFIAASLNFRGETGVVSSKHIRNFTINFKSNAVNAFEQISTLYGDIIGRYSKCGLGIRVERSARKCCGCFSRVS